PEGMVGVDLLGAEGGDHHDRRPPFGGLALPAVEETDREPVDPLAVIEQHQSRPGLGPEGVEQGGEGKEAPGLAVGLRSHVALPPRWAACWASSSRRRVFPPPESACTSASPPRPWPACSSSALSMARSAWRPTNAGSVRVWRRSR